jgi:quercetin dioxygenase-like cupin family protein
VPEEVAHLFTFSHFQNYPRIIIPQEFADHRGVIRNIADGKLGDVAVIESTPGAIRANHYHFEDWHFTYVVSGSIEYEWTTHVQDNSVQSIQFETGELIFTPSGVPHRMKFFKPTIFIAVSKLSRMAELYEKDTVRLDANFFNK